MSDAETPETGRELARERFGYNSVPETRSLSLFKDFMDCARVENLEDFINTAHSYDHLQLLMNRGMDQDELNQQNERRTTA